MVKTPDYTRLSTYYLPFAILLCTLVAPGGAQRSGPPQGDRVKAQESAVRDVVARYVAARERRDAEALRALFTEDADQLTSSGEWRRGREAIVRGGLASSESTGGTRTIAIESVRFPSPGVAVADGRYEIAGGQDGVRRMWTSLVMTRGTAGWRISAIRNMLPAAPAR